MHFPSGKEYLQVRRYFENHFSALWEHAQTFPSSTLIRNGVSNVELIQEYKWRLCASWIWHALLQVSRDTDLPLFKRRVLKELMPVKNWYRHILNDDFIRDPYQRYPLLSRNEGPLNVTGSPSQLDCEVMLARWKHGEECWPHDHGGSSGVVFILQGEASVNEYIFSNRELRFDPSVTEKRLKAGEGSIVERTTIHSMRSIGAEELVSLHVYLPEPGSIWIYDTKGRERLSIQRGGAFSPRDDSAIRVRELIGVRIVPEADLGRGSKRGRGRAKECELSNVAQERLFDLWVIARKRKLTKAEFLQEQGVQMPLDDLQRLIDRIGKRRKKQRE